MKLKICAALLFILTAFLIALSLNKSAAFAPAEDFPRGAMAYVQTDDLPALIHLWNESAFREKYLASENFQDFQNNHLGLKLASRLEEFNQAANVSFDAETLGGLAENRAAVALYDVGKLEFVFIAPVSDEIFAATKFVQNQDKFEEQTLEDGTIIYRADVEADRGRQKQALTFTHVKGRFVLTTSEKLLAQTLHNINGKDGKNKLSIEPSFKILSEKTNSGLATIWINQAVLNGDYYFKHYWLMSDTKELENIRAGIFELSTEEGKLIERRTFLLAQPVFKPSIEPATAEKSLAHLPENIPFYQLQAADARNLETAIRETIFERQRISAKPASRRFHRSSGDYNDFENPDYSSLGENFDETIDESEDDETIVKASETTIDFANILQPANPETVLTFTEPAILPAPLFVEFRRGAIFTFAAPGAFNQEAFESAIEKMFSSQVLIAAPGIGLKWETKTENNESIRELNLPMLGWKIGYALRGDKLFLANDTSFLQKIILTQNPQSGEKSNFPLGELTVLNFAQKESAYDAVFAELEEKNAADVFFTGNIKSLLDSAAAIKTISVKRNYAKNFLTEEITLDF